LKVTLSNANPVKLKVNCLVLPVSDPKKLSHSTDEIDQASDGFLREVLKQGDLAAKAGATLMLHKVPGIGARRVLLISTGSSDPISAADFEKMAQSQTTTLAKANVKDTCSCLTETPVVDRDLCWQAHTLTQIAVNQAYRFDLHKSKKTPVEDRKLTLHVNDRKLNKQIQTGIERGTAIANGMHDARDLENTIPSKSLC